MSAEQEEIAFAGLIAGSMTEDDIKPITKADFDRTMNLKERIVAAENRVFCDFKEALQRVMSKKESVRTMQALAKV